MTLMPSYKRTALLLRCAHEMGTLHSAQAALESVDSLSPADRARLEQSLSLARIRNALEALSAAQNKPSAAPHAAEEIPSSWPGWLKRLKAADSWKAAVRVAEIGAREWRIDRLLGDVNAVTETANLLLEDRSQWGQEALRDALPYFVESC